MRTGKKGFSRKELKGGDDETRVDRLPVGDSQCKNYTTELNASISIYRAQKSFHVVPVIVAGRRTGSLYYFGMKEICTTKMLDMFDLRITKDIAKICLTRSF